MLLFSRMINLRGPQAETMEWAGKVTAHVNTATGLDVACWVGLYGVPLGTVGWTTRVESHAHLAEEASTLASDRVYQDLIESAAGWIAAPGQDNLRSVVSGGRADGGVPTLGSVAMVTNAVIANGRIADAMTWSVEMADYAAHLTGAPVMFVRDLFGTFGGVGWISVVDDLTTLDKVQELTDNDAGYAQRLSAAGDLFVAGSGHTALFTRVA